MQQILGITVSNDFNNYAENDELRDLHVEQTRRTWDNASQSCNLFGSDKAPSYVASDQDITFFRHNRPKATITPSPEDLYWIGATSTFTPWFELLGNGIKQREREM